MKKTIFTMLAIAMMAGVSNNAMAQNSSMASNGAKATIIAPIAIFATGMLNFGVIIKGTGTVSVSPSSERTSDYASFTVTQLEDIKPASFSLTGEAGYTYSIVLPEDDTIVLKESGTDTMAVNKFICNSFTDGDIDLDGTIGVEGGDLIHVGATLTVSDSQTVGVYNGVFDVTISYN
ncbi:MAG: DUF4402 domain-containing protein [Flavobacteriaceae bacterium]|nr:DUF4402 domain-containing protein [Flavobacteriaceae bacterium]